MSGKVLMACMGLDIGGAETHVLELSKELKRRGYEIIIVSAGGAYEKELTDSGVKCIYAPLNQRSLSLMKESFDVLKNVIREEKPDIVHAHARIPGFICGILQKKMGFKFVTTAHWVFRVNPVLKRLTNWGYRTIAVSEDIRTYLKDNYGIEDEKITNTINGIDTEKFSLNTSREEILKECGFDPSKPVVSYVSRMDEDRSLAAELLIDNGALLREKIDGIQFVIAGGGNSFDRLKEKADRANKDAGTEYIKMLGARTDINEIVAAGDVFVGVSRAALEAMASEKPTVVAGNEGYIGIFDKDKLDVCIKTNFCARECPATDGEKLVSDIVKLFNASEDERRRLGSVARETVLEKYSVKRMADDAEYVYKKTVEECTSVLVSGYYGYQNLGDDTILISLRDELKKLLPSAGITVLSNSPEETENEIGINAVKRFNPFAVLKAMKSCSVFVSGGGSLLQDNTSTRSLMYYSGLIKLAKRYNKPVMFYSNGIGPVHQEKNRDVVRAVSEMADVITLRDSESFDELKAMGVKNEKIAVTSDCVYSMDYAEKERGLELLSKLGIRLNGHETEKPVIGISVRNVAGTDAKMAELAAFADGAASKGYEIVFLVMQTPQDEKLSKSIAALMKEKSYVFASPYKPEDMMAVIAAMKFLVSTRLHTIIFAAHQHTPVMGIVYDPKVESCLKSLSMPSAGNFRDFSAKEALNTFDEVMKDYDAYKDSIEKAETECRKASLENNRLLEELICLQHER